MEYLVCRLSDKSILRFNFGWAKNHTVFEQKHPSMEGDAIPLVNRDGRLLANKVQMFKPTTIPPEMELKLCCQLT